MRDSGGLCKGFNLGMSASRRVPGGDAAGQGAGLPKCKILFPLLIQSVRVNDHSLAPPDPRADESVNSLIVGVFGGFVFSISVSPQTRCISSLGSSLVSECTF